MTCLAISPSCFADGLPLKVILPLRTGELVSVIRMLTRDVAMEREDSGRPV